VDKQEYEGGYKGMNIKVIVATIKTICPQFSKAGDPGLNVIMEYDDGSQYGKRVYKWLWNNPDSTNKDTLSWAIYIDPDATEETISETLIGYKPCRLEIELLVDQTDNLWKVLKFGKSGSLRLKPTTSGVIDDDIPF